MAQRTLIQLVDDLDGKELADGKGETVTFAVDGTSYEIDLSNKHADDFRGLFQDYIAAGRKAAKTGGKRKAAAGPSDAKEVRAWAQDQGLDVPARGRIPQEIRDQYDAAS